jgi:hypothetical protein
MFTNGSRTLRWWNSFLEQPIVDFIMFTYHHAQVNDRDQFIANVNSIHDYQINGLVFFTCTDIDFGRTVEDLEYISEKIGIDCHLKKIHGTILNNYTEEQHRIFLDNRVVPGKRESTKVKASEEMYDVFIETEYIDGTLEKIHDPQEFLARGQNKFLFWDCDIGIDRIVIYSDKVYKSICQVGNPIYTIYDDFVPVTSPTKCMFNTCTCGTDIMESKRSPMFKKSIPILSR